MATDPNGAVIETEDLTVYYGKHRGIIDVNLSVDRGEVFGFLGPNGAGKTTSQRVLLDLIRPTAGSARVFGMDSKTDGTSIRGRIGYLPGELSLYPNMTGSRFLDLIGSLNPKGVESSFVSQLEERLDFDPSRKIKEYSRGNKQKIGIVAAFMGKPDLLILDEPTTGLDPLIQRTVMELVREVKKDGRTVFFSSHILQEVQEVCDRVGIIREGSLVKTEKVETLTKQSFKRLELTLRKPPPENAFSIDGVTETKRDGHTVMLEVRNSLDRVIELAVKFGIEDIDTSPVTLEEIFLTFYGEQSNGGNDA